MDEFEAPLKPDGGNTQTMSAETARVISWWNKE